MKSRWVFCVWMLAACSSGEDGVDASADATEDAQVETDTTLPDASAPDADGVDALLDASKDATLDATPDAPLFVGEPPESMTFRSNNDQHFELLPDDSTFTNFVREGARLQVLPLEAKNFPDDEDFCTVGSDTMLNNLQQYARARLVPTIRDWNYNVVLRSVAESDGESEYQLVINGDVRETFRNPETSGNLGDMDSVDHTFASVVIRDGDDVEIRARAHSNLKVTEGGGCRNWDDTYAWARGRWIEITLEAAPL